MKFLVCGVGSIGERHIRNLMHLGFEDIILFRQRNLPLRTVEKNFPTYHSLTDALMERPNVAFITNPTSLHIPVAIECAKAGCHLFIEKPVSNNLNGLDELRRYVAQKNLIVFVGFQFRFHPGLKRTKALLDNKAIGKVFHVEAHWGEYLPDWHPWEDYQIGYSAREELGGGVILTLSHPFDYLRWLIDEIECVIAMGGTFSNLDIDVEDMADGIIRFKSDTIGYVHLDYIQRPPVHRLHITGSKGIIIWDYYEGKVHLYRSEHGNWELFQNPKDFERNSMFIDELIHFIDCIENKKSPLIDLDDGLKTLKVLLAIKKSISEKRMIYIEN